MRVLIGLPEEGCKPVAAEFRLNWRRWLGRKDSNPRSPDPESGALPLGYSPSAGGRSSIVATPPPATPRRLPTPPPQPPDFSTSVPQAGISSLLTMTSLRPEQLLTVARAYRPTPSGGGSLYFASDMAGLSQTYRLDAADHFPVRLAPSQDRTLPVAETPLGLLVRQDQGGNETWQLALVGPDGILKPVTRDRKAIHRDVKLGPDRRKAGISYNPGGQDDWVLAVIDLETGNIEHWVDRGGDWSWLAWSPDGTRAVVARATHS